MFELRDYQAVDGKMPALLRRFEEHTIALFPEHNIHNVGYWISQEDPNRLVYMVRHDGDPAANWESFKNDPRWIAARDASQADGPLTSSIQSTYLSDAGLRIE